jgi:response regulator RpfG family c-di-GMP phosphodiesterase
MRPVRSTLTLFTLLLVCLPAAAEIYKCTDGSGAVQYGDKPCAENSILIKPAAAPAADAHVVERRQRTDKLLRAYDEEHAEAQRTQAMAAAASQQRRQECTRARDWLERVRYARGLYRVGEDGSQVGLNDAERAAAMAKAEADVARWCD